MQVCEHLPRLARRLVEAGTQLVQVNWHNDGSDVKSPF